jgi:thiosulfate reductase cytochrome b subunit
LKQIEPKHPLLIRWSHWLNVPILAVMIGSGMLIYWANDEYRLGFGAVTVFHFFPEWFYKTLNISSRLAEGMAWHFLFMWLFAVNGLVFALYTLWSGEWRDLLPNRSTPAEAWAVVKHDLRLSHAEPPKRKFNGAQRIAYTGVIAMGAASLLTGIAVYKPIQFGWLARLLGGYKMARWEHFWLTMGYCGFIVMHVVQVARAGWNNFQAMVTGRELVEAAPTVAVLESEVEAGQALEAL